MPPERVYLLRHGQGEHNATGRDIRDALLTSQGEQQAASWARRMPSLDIDVVLISPLRRTIQTALLAFELSSKSRLVLCRHARELWWSEEVNALSSASALTKLLGTLPRGEELVNLDDGRTGDSSRTSGTGSISEVLAVTNTTPRSESASIEALMAELRARSENRVAVVCHWGVISDLCGESCDNAALVECKFNDKNLVCLKVYPAPGGGRTF